MNPLEIIRTKATTHALKFRKFNLNSFMNWIEGQSVDWQCWAASRTISYLNQNRRYNSWQIQVDGRKTRYTMSPPEDGPR